MSLVDLGKRLLESAKLGNTEDVRMLMSNGAPFTTDWLGTSPLHFSAQNGHLMTVETLLRAGISRDARTKVDRTPLHVAAQEGHIHIASLLLDHQADVDAKDMLKMTPLHWAAEKAHVDVIELLLKFGADVNSLDKFDRTPIDIPFANGRADIAQMLQLAPGARTVEGLRLDLDTAYETVITDTDITESDLIDTDKIIPVSLVAGGDDETALLSQQDVSSTSVLSTLAALAEATASTQPSKHTKTSEALSWLENHGITMVSTNDGSIVTSAVESGHSIAITEAGKVALDMINDQADDEEEMGVPGEDGDIGSRDVEVMVDINDDHESQVVTIITEHGDAITSDSELITVAGETTIEELYEPPPMKRTRRNSGKMIHDDASINIQKQLEEAQMQAKMFKKQLHAKEKEAKRFQDKLKAISK